MEGVALHGAPTEGHDRHEVDQQTRIQNTDAPRSEVPGHHREGHAYQAQVGELPGDAVQIGQARHMAVTGRNQHLGQQQGAYGAGDHGQHRDAPGAPAGQASDAGGVNHPAAGPEQDHHIAQQLTLGLDEARVTLGHHQHHTGERQHNTGEREMTRSPLLQHPHCKHRHGRLQGTYHHAMFSTGQRHADKRSHRRHTHANQPEHDGATTEPAIGQRGPAFAHH